MVVIMMFHVLMIFILGILATLAIQHVPSEVKDIKEDVHDQKKLPEPWQVAEAWHNTLGDK